MFGVRMAARVQAKSLVRSSIPMDRRVTFSHDADAKCISGQSVTWKEDNEFVLAGHVYDVLRRYDSSGVEVIVAVLDGADSWLHAAIGREQDRQARQKTTSGPIRELLKELASCKAVTADRTNFQPPWMRLMGHTSQPAHELLSGYHTAVDRPPPMA